MAQPELLYYYIQKYLLTGDETAHEQIKSLKNTVDTYKGTVYDCGYSLNDAKFDNPGYILSYIVEKNRTTDTAVVNYFKNAIIKGADAVLAERAKYVFPVGNNPKGTGWGHNTAQPAYACAPILAWSFNHNQLYIDAACDLMNYIFGLNPLGICYVTTLGFHQIHYPHDRESSYAFSKKMGHKPGITIFGPGIARGATAVSFPVLDSLPMERYFSDNREMYSMTEFTIFQSETHNALFTVLSSGGTWDGKTDPFAGTAAVKHPLKLKSLSDSPKVTANMTGNVLKFKITAKTSGNISGAIYSVNGKKIMNIDFGTVSAGTKTFTVSLDKAQSQKFAHGIFISKLAINNQTVVNSFVRQKR